MLHDQVVAGDTVVVRIESPCKGGTFREILTLLRSAGRWQIAFNAFDVS
ncbi:nuclear transport factor 2 family protein [Defluviimonas sp. WL0075]|uniref:Nuclear transport factor 2 family protein n=1 Tax=Albidovulum sediminicola TaxID=2984331 RepID=A0ABT2Z0Q5_9RHOB|nr:nuclear transport factor 2 family protein [Defluviimonas sp. WL0075]MCV2864316.1 nuclear transport factor 2 family protein [Defluviimonas sp. WL0075]